MKNNLVMPTRILRDYLSSSLVWKDFIAQGGFAAGDIVVADPFKAGTTWTQRIIQQVFSNGEEPNEDLSMISPWLDSSFGNHEQMLALLREQKQRRQQRVIKSHLPADAVPIDRQARYIFVGRNGKDLGISLHNYLRNFSEETMAKINRIYAAWSNDPSPLLIPQSTKEFFDWWLDMQGGGCCDLFDITASWWKLRDEPNILLLHYTQLQNNLLSQMVRIAKFVGVDPEPLRVNLIAEHCSFAYMRSRAEQMIPFSGAHMSNPNAFFHKGPQRNYREELSPQEIKRFDRIAIAKLGADCAHWLETGDENSRAQEA